MEKELKLVETDKLDIYLEIDSKFRALQNDIHTQIMKEVEYFILFHLRNSDSPPIQGQLTKENLDAVDIRIIRMVHPDGVVYWLEQHQEKISPELKVSLKADMSWFSGE